MLLNLIIHDSTLCAKLYSLPTQRNIVSMEMKRIPITYPSPAQNLDGDQPACHKEDTHRTVPMHYVEVSLCRSRHLSSCCNHWNLQLFFICAHKFMTWTFFCMNFGYCANGSRLKIGFFQDIFGCCYSKLHIGRQTVKQCLSLIIPFGISLCIPAAYLALEVSYPLSMNGWSAMNSPNYDHIIYLIHALLWFQWLPSNTPRWDLREWSFIINWWLVTSSSNFRCSGCLPRSPWRMLSWWRDDSP